MQLEDFIKESLVQIANGVSAAAKELNSSGAIVNPRNVAAASKETFNVYGLIAESNTMRRAVHSIEFDVAVTATGGTETKGGIGVIAGAIALGTQGKSQESNSSVSRLSFSIPMALPNADA
jgi:hypothetical protein